MYLGIETSSVVSSVALMKAGKLLGELTVQAGLMHSEQLVPHIENLLTQARANKKELSGIAVSIGPGSFTGLRIGLGTAKAMAYGLGIPLVEVMTMEGLAYNLPYCSHLLSVMIDAQKKNVYEGRYRFAGERLICVQEPKVIARTAALEELKALGEPVVFLGDGAIMGQREISEVSPDFTLAPMGAQIPRAGAVLQAALPYIAAGQTVNPMEAVPYYIRRSEAEELWEKRHGK